MSNTLTRLAPTPSGYLHIGNVFNLLYAWLLGKADNGQVLLRIDDLDKDRRRPEYVADIFETLEWLGLEYDQGPTGPDDLYKNWSQEKRLDLYNELLRELAARDLLFACDCSRKSLSEKGISGHYPNICVDKGLSLNSELVAWRVRVYEGTTITFEDGVQGKVNIDLYDQQGSFVVRRKDEIPAYQIASLADDIHFGITHLARGEDLLDSTAAQLFLSQVIENQIFSKIKFYHHSLLTGPEGNKLSKSAGSLSIQQQRQAGISRQMIFGQFARWAELKTSPEPTLQELLAAWRQKT